MTQEMFHTRLKKIMNEYVHIVYALTRHFHKEELYGFTSQLCRAALSVILNYFEGYARVQEKVHKIFSLFSTALYKNLITYLNFPVTNITYLRKIPRRR